MTVNTTPFQQALAKPDSGIEATASASKKMPIDEHQVLLELPITGYHDEIINAVKNNQVVVICGETGSGKSTQLPQMLLAAGFAGNTAIDVNVPNDKLTVTPKFKHEAKAPYRRIAHTQPRRVAAISLAKRISEEYQALHPRAAEKTIGYKIRFEEKVASSTLVKLMTDGILIAETANDKDLQQYSVIIIDEAHERNINIDFLLGYLRTLLKRRADLRVIITSATLDAKHFSKFFANAPVINVEGRSFPIAIRYRPLAGSLSKNKEAENDDKESEEQRKVWQEDRREERLPKAIGDAILELWNDSSNGGVGDVLVFLPGEGEIRTIKEYLPGFFTKTIFSSVEILPLMSRLSSAEQMKIFNPLANSIRIILATNIAETSLTVPRIRYVVDSGLARVLRYSPRMKINRLDIEPIAQDSAKQRAGRCGRTSAGICVRLYDEDEFQERPAQSTPEILRSSLSLVLLRLLALKWGDIKAFPWIDPPSPRIINHGLADLADLGAIELKGSITLTKLGERMARIPIDHTLSRMLIEADKKKVLSAVLIVVSAMATRETRELPMGNEKRASQAHKLFEDERSDFITLINLWHSIELARHNAVSNSAFRKWCKSHFLSWMRVREWRELHLQLQSQMRRIFVHYHSPSALTQPNKPMDDTVIKHIHQSVLCGLPTQIGCKHDTENFYQGARGIKFFADRRWSNRKARWILCGEMIATPRTIGRRIAKLEKSWIVEALPHLLDIKWLDYFWDKGQQSVMIHRQISLQGLMIEPRQRVNRYPPTDEDYQIARELFIRGALMAGEIRLPAPHNLFLAHNKKVLDDLIDQENRSRRPNSLVNDDNVFCFYQEALNLIAPTAINTRDFLCAVKDFWANRPNTNDNPLLMDFETWIAHTHLGRQEDFPGQWIVGELSLPIRYTFAPGTADDGMSITVDEIIMPILPCYLCDWLVRGMRLEKVSALIKTLPKKMRFALRHVAADFVKEVEPSNSPLVVVLAKYCSDILCVTVLPILFREENIANHLKMRVRVVNSYGAVVLDTRQSAQLEAFIANQQKKPSAINDSISAQTLLSSSTEAPTVGLSDEAINSWQETHGVLPRKQPMKLAGQDINGWAVLALKGDEVFICAFTDEHEAIRAHEAALIRMAMAPLAAQIKAFRGSSILKLSLPQTWFTDDETLKQTVVATALAQVVNVEPLPNNSKSFEARLQLVKPRFLLIAAAHLSLLQQLAVLYKQASTLIQKTTAHTLKADCENTLATLFGADFFQKTPIEQRKHLPRFTEAIIHRIEKYPKNPERDQKNAKEINSLQDRVRKLTSNYQISVKQSENFYWLIQELRVGIFAQELKTPFPISVKRIEKMLK